MSSLVHLHLQRESFTLNVQIELPSQGITVLFGPSGCGKTTVLRCVAGLDRAQGLVHIGEVWQDDARGVFLPTWQRNLGYVFQEASLFEHLDVLDNLRFGIKRHGIRSDVPADIVEMLGIDHLLKRRVQQLSGGERQRVAIARALATRPGVLLLDEPLASLDLSRRQEILPWLERLRDELHIPMLYVTHAADEVARLADHLVVMAAGHIVAQGDAASVMGRIDPPVIDGHEAAALITGHVAACETQWHLARVDFEGGSLWVRDDGLRTGRQVRLRVLARDVSVATQEPAYTSIQNQLRGRIDAITQDQHPSQSLVRIQVGATYLIARLTNKAIHQLGLQLDTPVWAQVKSVALVQ